MLSALPRPRPVVFVIFEGLQSLDLTGPLEVFARANRDLGREAYVQTVVSSHGDGVRSSSGLALGVDGDLAGVDGPIDTLVVVGGDGTYGAVEDAHLIAEVQRLAPHARRVASVCSGAFVLAVAGLLDGRRATTHWSACQLLADTFPTITVEPDPIWVRDGNVYSSAGVTAGMDLALALVEEDHGRDIALGIARELVLFLRRPANQSQFSAQLAAQMAERDSLREAQHHVLEHPESDCSVAALARLAHMSERNFTRCFTAEVGLTPARYVERVRVEAARRLLEDSDKGVEAVARSSGFGTTETMRRTFLRVLRTTPTEYRRRFRAA